METTFAVLSFLIRHWNWSCSHHITNILKLSTFYPSVLKYFRNTTSTESCSCAYLVQASSLTPVCAMSMGLLLDVLEYFFYTLWNLLMLFSSGQQVALACQNILLLVFLKMEVNVTSNLTNIERPPGVTWKVLENTTMVFAANVDLSLVLLSSKPFKQKASGRFLRGTALW